MHVIVFYCLNLLLATVLIVGSAVSSFSTESTLETSMEEFVKQVIRDNPELIVKTLNEYVLEQKAAQKDPRTGVNFNKRLEDIVTPENPSRGLIDAPITIISYSEFQCPYCKRAAKTLRQVMDAYPGQVRIVFKNLPMPFHKEAIPAAHSALAAKRQGKFWEYYDALFTDGTPLNEKSYRDIAANLELNLEQFDVDRHSKEVANQVLAEAARAQELNLKATPSFIINGVLVQGARPLEYFSKIIDRLLQEKNDTIKKQQ